MDEDTLIVPGWVWLSEKRLKGGGNYFVTGGLIAFSLLPLCLFERFLQRLSKFIKDDKDS